MAFHGEEMLELIDGHGSNHGLANEGPVLEGGNAFVHHRIAAPVELASDAVDRLVAIVRPVPADAEVMADLREPGRLQEGHAVLEFAMNEGVLQRNVPCREADRSEEHTSELQSLIRT